VRKNSIRKIISHLAESTNYISKVIVAEDVTFLNIYNKSEDEVLRLLVSKLPSMALFTCQYIKKDGSICGKGCWRPEGCSRHFNALPRIICPVCKQGTYSDTGICNTHSGPYDRAWRESKKTNTESDVVKTLS
jgi:hypothetical protein